jgi:hypothetical protein
MKPVVETLGRIQASSAFVLSAFVAGVFAFVAAVAGGVIGIYLYDRGMSKVSFRQACVTAAKWRC